MFKKWTLSLTTLFLQMLSADSFGQNILVQAPGVSEAAFFSFANENSQDLTYSLFIQRGLQRNENQEARLFKLTDLLEKNLTEAIAEMKQLTSEAPLTLLSLRYLKDFAEKALSQRISASERKELVHLYCKSSLLLKEGPAQFDCSAKALSFKSLKKQYPLFELVLIESVPFMLSEHGSFVVAADTAYHWTLLSNSKREIHFFGTFSQLQTQHLQSENLVEGSCDQFATQGWDLNLSTSGVIYFSADCKRRPVSQDHAKHWSRPQKSWWYVAGAIALGGLAYTMKDKTLVIDASGIK